MKILISDRMHESIIPLIESEGFKVDYRPEIKRPEILDIIRDYTGLVIRSKTPIDRELLQKAEKLRFVGRAGAGIDQIDMEEAFNRRIHILNAPEGNRDAVAEHTVGMILSLLNKMPSGDREVRSGIWQREANRGRELNNKTVSIIGFGYMGEAVSRRLRPFGCDILAYDKYKKGLSTAVREVDLEKVFENTDILSLHVPLTAETKFAYNYEFFQNFKKEIMLINTARGEILPLDDLVKLMDEGKIWAAGLDVLQNEKIDKLSAGEKALMENLWAHPNTIFTPHVAGWSNESYRKINETLVNKIKLLNLV